MQYSMVPHVVLYRYKISTYMDIVLAAKNQRIYEVPTHITKGWFVH